MSVVDFLSGICMATFAASGIFFLKFWIASRDRFFLLFCLACWLIAIERVALLFWSADEVVRSTVTETDSWVYLIRLAAFLLIFVAILEKNRGLRR